MMSTTLAYPFNNAIPPATGPYVSPRLGKLATALASAQKEFTPVSKDNTADTGKFKYNYADLASILKMALPILSKHGIFFSQDIKTYNGEDRVYTRLMLGDEILESGGIPIPAKTLSPQDFGKYHSYFRRYDACALLGIAPDDDVDANTDAKITKREVSTSGQEEKYTGPKQANSVRQSRPATAKTVVAPEPPVHAAPPIANDSDVPEVIGDKPNSDEMKAIKEKLFKFEVDRDKLKAYVLKVSEQTDTKNVTKHQWLNVLTNLNTAQQNGSLADLVK
jgi:ERF superfamily